MSLPLESYSSQIKRTLSRARTPANHSDLVKALLDSSLVPRPVSFSAFVQALLGLLGLMLVCVKVLPRLEDLLPRWMSVTLIIAGGGLLALVVLYRRFAHLDHTVRLETVEEPDQDAVPDSEGNLPTIARIDHLRLGALGNILSLHDAVEKVFLSLVLMGVLALSIFLTDSHLGFDPAPTTLVQAFEYASGSTQRWLFALLEMHDSVEAIPSPDSPRHKVVLVVFRFFIEGLLLVGVVQTYQTIKLRLIISRRGLDALTVPAPAMYAFRRFPEELIFITAAQHFAHGHFETARVVAALCPELDMDDDVRALFQPDDGRPIFVKPATRSAE
jgi:hypothetical protein